MSQNRTLFETFNTQKSLDIDSGEFYGPSKFHPKIYLKVISCRHMEIHQYLWCLICKRDNFFREILSHQDFQFDENSKRFEFGSFSSVSVVQMANQRLLLPFIGSLQCFMSSKL